MSAFYTHQPFLIEILNSFSYEVPVKCLEFGVGEGSSSIFSKFIKDNPSLSVSSYESDEGWLNSMKRKYGSDRYTMNFVPDWNQLDFDDLREDFDLVFVDQAPWEARTLTIEKLKEKSKIIMLHDYYNSGLPDKEKTYFHKNYEGKFDLIEKKEFYPPTLIFKRKRAI